MVDLEGFCVGEAANSGTLTVEIHLSPTTPQIVIQQILALVVAPESEGRIIEAKVGIEAGTSVKASPEVQASSFSSADIKIRLLPVEGKKSKASLMTTLAVLLIVSQITYHVSGTADHTLQFLEHYRSYFQTKINGSVVPIDQAKETIKNAEPTPKNEQSEKSGNLPAFSSEGD
jgi:hypothetical protein